MSVRKRWIAAVVVALIAAVAGGTVHAQAESGEPDSRQAASVRSMTFNVCGAACDFGPKPGLDKTLAQWTAATKAQMKQESSEIVGFQELCFAQWKSLREAMPEYKPVWVSTIPNGTDGCERNWKRKNPDWETDDDRFGLGVFVKTEVKPDRFTATLDTPDDLEGRAVLCAKAPVDGVSVLACNTHLAQYIKPDNGVSQVLGHIDDWRGESELVLTADLNAAPFYPATDALYERYLEADSTDTAYFTEECAGAETCRSGEPTTDDVNPKKKFDFIFATASGPAGVSADASPTALSDHHILRAVTTW